MTNQERILRLIHVRPGLSDAEIMRESGVEPHQQVNQICRRLEDGGAIDRRRRPDGRIGNYPVGARAIRDDAPASTAPIGSYTEQAPRRSVASPALAVDPTKTLFVIPCSAAKVRGGAQAASGPHVTQLLTPALVKRLLEAREALVHVAQLDETKWLPASRRYTGRLYQAAAGAIADLRAAGAQFAIISGGYGVVLADEPIGHYEKVFRSNDWPGGIVANSMVEIARALERTSVIGILAATSSYARVFRATQWPGGMEIRLVAPERRSGGAMVAAPEAQGEILGAISRGVIPEGWRSKRGLGLEVEALT